MYKEATQMFTVPDNCDIIFNNPLDVRFRLPSSKSVATVARERGFLYQAEHINFVDEHHRHGLFASGSIERFYNAISMTD